MLWSAVDLTKLLLEPGRGQRQKISYDGKPFRFQLPECKCVDGLSEYNQMTVEVPVEFADWFESLEEYIGIHQPWKSVMNDGYMTLKIDDSTQIFDADKKLTHATEFQGCMIKCILEVSSIYFFKDTYGLTCRIYQLLSSEPECLFN